MTRNKLEWYLGKCVTITLLDNTVIEGTLHKTGEKAFADNPNLSVLLNFYFCIDENNEVVKNTVFRVSHIQKISCNEKLRMTNFEKIKSMSVHDMTTEKAIEVLNGIGEGANIEDMLKNLSNLNTFKAIRLAVHALEKQLPKKLKEVTRTSSNKKSRIEAWEHNYNHKNWEDPVPIPEHKECQWTDYQCPVCNALTKEGRPEFCWRCGQAFDWSDEVESENNESLSV